MTEGMSNNPEAGPGYRLLNKGEQILAGDEAYTWADADCTRLDWVRFSPSRIRSMGAKCSVDEGHVPVRRFLNSKAGIVKTRSGHYVVWCRTLDARQRRWTSNGMSLHGARGLLEAIQSRDVETIRCYDSETDNLIQLLEVHSETQGE